MIRLEFQNPRCIYNKAEEWWQEIYGIEGDFIIRSGEKILYEEPFFNIVELAVALSEWIKGNKKKRTNFEFTSIDSDVVGLVWIKNKNGKWQVGSIYQNFIVEYCFSWKEIKDIVTKYIHSVEIETKEKLDIDISKYL